MKSLDNYLNNDCATSCEKFKVGLEEMPSCILDFRSQVSIELKRRFNDYHDLVKCAFLLDPRFCKMGFINPLFNAPENFFSLCKDRLNYSNNIQSKPSEEIISEKVDSLVGNSNQHDDELHTTPKKKENFLFKIY